MTTDDDHRSWIRQAKLRLADEVLDPTVGDVISRAMRISGGKADLKRLAELMGCKLRSEESSS